MGDLDMVFTEQRAHHTTVRQESVRDRIRKLRRLHEAILRRVPEICKAVYADLGKASTEVMIMEVYPVLAEIRHAIRHLTSWAKPTRKPFPVTLFGARCEVRAVPKGVVLVVSPWNYPFMLAMGPLVSAVAAGNCVMVKPSEYSPHTSKCLRELVDSVFEGREVTVVEGDADIARRLLELPFNHIFFTGSTQVGKLVMEAASQHLASVTLELGGKSPAIVHESADIAEAAEKVAWGKFVNAGQTCVAPDYCLVPERLVGRFAELLASQIGAFYGSDYSSRRPSDFGRIASPRHLARLVRLVEEARACGARVVVGGHPDPADLYMPPTVLTDVPLTAAVMQEEIFGPILPIVPYGHVDEAISVANSLGPPLALYVLARGRQAQEYILSRTMSGDAVINGVVVHTGAAVLPFGGTGSSGVGKSHGHAGFMAFSHQRSVVRLPRHTSVRLFYPPYGQRAKRLAQLAVRWF